MLRVRRRAAAAAAAALASTSLITSCTPQNESAAGDDGPARFEHQEIAWHSCKNGPKDPEGAELDKAGAQCAEITVPLDYQHPDGRTIKVAISRLRATNTAHRHGTLLYNPGGPGVPVRYLALQLRHAAPVLATNYDVIGMDPRFVGRSTPLNCHWPTVSIGSAGPDRGTFEKTVKLAKDLASRCDSHRSVLPHASTRNTARDIDVIRAALGEKKISYLGSSYGTYLGQVYTQLFPNRVDRVVLDSALNADDYGPDLTSTLGPPVTRVLQAWAAWAARHDRTYHLGSTATEVMNAINELNKIVNLAPIQVGSHTVNSQNLPQLLWNATAGDSDEAYASYSADVRVLVSASHGHKVIPTQTLDQVLTDLTAPDTDGTFAVQTAIQCADRAATSRNPETYYRNIQAHRADDPIFGPLTRTVTPCAFWSVTPAEPPTEVHNDVPLLMVGATGDPATTYQGQLAAHHDLKNSRLVTLRGAFHHTVYAGLFAPKNRCIDEAVNYYLKTGGLPPSDTNC
ncbi:alpha/beta hydrolase [Streptomyces sp. NRRL S-1022]|uniref:alpha/beta hydrolase n=1 Tax=Streptomyces sp. NRRL S-1022 TaxID=1463880 RepID=UPI0004C14572|nr:alpha/beta hydrolase [Streptomyces sp. NRRL S-1022]